MGERVGIADWSLTKMTDGTHHKDIRTLYYPFWAPPFLVDAGIPVISTKLLNHPCLLIAHIAPDPAIVSGRFEIQTLKFTPTSRTTNLLSERAMDESPLCAIDHFSNRIDGITDLFHTHVNFTVEQILAEVRLLEVLLVDDTQAVRQNVTLVEEQIHVVDFLAIQRGEDVKVVFLVEPVSGSMQTLEEIAVVIFVRITCFVDVSLVQLLKERRKRGHGVLAGIFDDLLIPPLNMSSITDRYLSPKRSSKLCRSVS